MIWFMDFVVVVQNGGSRFSDAFFSFVRKNPFRFQYWYQGCFRIHLSLMPASVRILMEAASAAVTVCFTDCIRFWALPINISVASWSSSVPARVGKSEI